jgi:hypothetical protein
MHWWIAITLLVASAMAYAYHSHRRDGRDLTALFAPLAVKYGGDVRPASLLVLPQLRFEHDGGRYLVTAMPNNGAHEGASGPFTFVDVELPSDTGQKIRVERRGAGRCVDPTLPGAAPITGLQAFEDAFRIRAGNPTTALHFLEAPVRRKLLESRLPRLEARVEGQKVSVHMDGIAESREEVEELIDIAALLVRN